MNRIIATDADWDLFETKYNIQRNDMAEVPNVYRSINKLFVKKDDLDLYNELRNMKDETASKLLYVLTCNSAKEKMWKQLVILGKHNKQQ